MTFRTNPLSKMTFQRLFCLFTLFRCGLDGDICFILNHHCGDQCLLCLGSWFEITLL